MWTDRLPIAQQRKLIEDLRGVLPPPRAAAASGSVRLSSPRTAVEAAAGLQALPGFVWLDRSDAANRLFANPLVRLEVTAGHATVTGPGGRLSSPVRGFDLLEAVLRAWNGPAAASLCGYLGYELGAELEDVATPARRPADVPDLALGLYDFALEQRGGEWWLTGTDAWRGRAGLPFAPGEAEALLERPLATAPPWAGPLTPGPIAGVPAAFAASVERIVRRIYDGEVFQVNICRSLEAPLDEARVWDAYLRLRAISPASQGAFIRLDSHSAILSVSPELFLSVRDRQVRSAPIKGTRRRGAIPVEDQLLAAELAHSAKDRAELAMIVDVVRNDLGRVCAAGSVEVPAHAHLLSLPTVHHTYSEVTGRLRDDEGLASLLRACFPPASISGAPKIRAMELAAQEEGVLRGPCMGSIGWLSLDGSMELSVAIRTAVASAGQIRYLAGCGITAGSDPALELAESDAKAAAFIAALKG